MESLGFQVISEQPFGKYFLDCCIQEDGKDFGFEFDGPWHMKSRDLERDAWILENCSVPIMRIRGKDFRNVELLKERIVKFVEEKATA